VTDLRASYHDTWKPWARGDGRVHFVVHNQGNIQQGATYDVILHGQFGQSVTLSQGKIQSILPGDSVDVTLPNIALWPAIKYTASVKVHGVPAVGDPVAAPVTVSAGFWAWPWPQLLVLLALALWIWLRVWWRRRRKAKAASVPPPTAPVLSPGNVPDPQPSGAK
jgi:hypothetical protein